MTEKRDWSRVEKVMNPIAAPSKQAPEQQNVIIETGHRDTPAPLIVAPKLDDQDFLVKWKAGRISRKAALEAMQTHYDSQLDVFRETMAQKVKVQKTKLGLIAEEYLNSLDSEHLERLQQFGMRNTATRWKAITDLTDAAVAKINEVQSKDWPDALINETIAQILDLRKRVVAELVKELGSEHDSRGSGA
jgi:hypothetical protein